MTASALKSTPPPVPLAQQSLAIRAHLVAALKADVIGPFAPLDADNDDATELLPHRPTRWYLTGFLTPEGARERAVEPTSEEEPAAGDDKPSQDGNDSDPGPRVKHRWPASLGLSVLLPPGPSTDTLEVSVRYAEYRPEEAANDDASADGEDEDAAPTLLGWRRVPKPVQSLAMPLDEDVLRRGVELPDAPGLLVMGKLGEARGRGLPERARALSLFLVNRRPVPEPKRPDEQCIFQVELSLRFRAGLLARPNLQGEGSAEWDDNVSDLQFRERCEFAVGHGVAVEVAERSATDPTHVTAVRTTWLPQASVLRVKTRGDDRVETRMEALGALSTPEAVRAALAKLPEAYGEWIAEQRTRRSALSEERASTLDALMDAAEDAQKRIAAGIERVATHETVRRAFQLANLAMATAAERRTPADYDTQRRPRWRLFQLAFVLLNISGIADPEHDDREAVDLIFFPTGGGKTEAYLGVIAFTLLLRRLEGRGRPDQGLGVAVILRYTLRLLTLDQLSRAATLICALERLRHAHPGELGSVRFSIGLWVGRGGAPNTLKDAARAIGQYNNDRSANAASPFPLSHCPWCRSERLRDGTRPFELKRYPSNRQSDPERIIVSCTDHRCEFSEGKDRGGVPVVFVDEQIYRELPSFLVATVDKFAMLPWRGETGMFFGRARAFHDWRFYGPMDRASRNAVALPDGLRPPELVVQDELHLISGPLGTLVGLYETAVDALCARVLPSGKRVRPKVIAATATVRRSDEQCRALFARRRCLFPPPGPDEGETFFAELDHESAGRLYVGVAAPGRAMKAILLRCYIALLAAAQKHFDPAASPEQAADAYMTLAGYFNSLRELGGMRRLVEDDVRARVMQAEQRKPKDWTGPHPWYRNRQRWLEPVELTSREKTERIKQSKARLAEPYTNVNQAVDVVLASNMISVGVDITRLGLMVVAGQPKTTSEYIQASSRVGRSVDYPGLVVTCFNVIRPRDRSHYERFSAYHESFYRHVEATSVTPFSGPALDRGLAGTLIAMTRLGETALTPPDAAMDFSQHRATIGEEAVRQLVERASDQCRSGEDELPEQVRQRARKLLDHWEEVIALARTATAQRTYSGYDIGQSWSTAFVHRPLEERPPLPTSPESHFVAPTSLRDVEPTVPLWLPDQKAKGGS